MSAASHTPGPWTVVRQSQGARGGGGDLQINFSPLKFFFLPFTEENAANAHLIAAAPELLKALEAVREAYSTYQLIANPTKPFAIAIVDDAIRKAKGEL